MSALERIRRKVNQNPHLRRGYDRVKSGVQLIFYYLVRENLSDEIEIDLKPRLDEHTVRFLGPTDMKTISASPEVYISEDKLIERLDSGCRCLGIAHHGDIVAYVWCNLRKCDSRMLSFPLTDDEAYLFDARTFKAYRGKNLAPYLRYQLYQHLTGMGRTRFFSITALENTEALRFKKKLRAKPIRLYLFIDILGKHCLNLLLKNYERQESEGARLF